MGLTRTNSTHGGETLPPIRLGIKIATTAKGVLPTLSPSPHHGQTASLCLAHPRKCCLRRTMARKGGARSGAARGGGGAPAPRFGNADISDDEVDAFHTQRDKILLDDQDDDAAGGQRDPYGAWRGDWRARRKTPGRCPNNTHHSPPDLDNVNPSRRSCARWEKCA